MRPETVTVNLISDGEISGTAVSLNEENDWSYTWNGLDKYKNTDGEGEAELIDYTVREVSVPEYLADYTEGTDPVTGYELVTIKNSYTPVVTDYSVEKVWNDGNNQDGKRPESIKVQLYEVGVYVHKSYPDDLASISYTISENDTDIALMNVSDYEKMFEEEIYNSYGDEVDVAISKYERIKLDGRDALQIFLSFEFKGTICEQLIYMIDNGKETHIMCYTQEQGGKWTEAFEKSGETISLKPK